MRYFFFKMTILFISSIFFVKLLNAQKINFNDYFEDATLRIDYYLQGNNEQETYIPAQLKKDSIWAGKKNLTSNDTAQLGNYRFIVFDSVSNQLLYSQGFSSLFQEWQSTPEAKLINKSFYHVNRVPFPKQTIRFELQKRAYNSGNFTTITSIYINPKDIFINKEHANYYKTFIEQKKGVYNNKIDLVFLAEGYTKKEMSKFKKDVHRVWEYFKTIPPYNQYSSYFNVYGVESVSQESGTDIPGDHLYKNTALNFSFFTFNIERYLTSTDLNAIHDAAEVIPYDHIFILINTNKYGGGGFYNYYSAATSDNELSLKVAIHEFGHGFAGLADEYYTSDVAYDGYYNLKTEPWEPNITTMINFKAKWKDMIVEGTPVPTPRNAQYNDSVGVFEGGGYAAKGIYSPVQDCRMKSNVPQGFCPVCSKAIQEAIISQIDE